MKYLINKLNKIAMLVMYRIKKPLETYQYCPDYFRSYRKFLKSDLFERVLGGWKVGEDFYPDYLFMGGASKAIEQVALKFLKGEKGIDIGAGYWCLTGAMAIDLYRGDGKDNNIKDIAIESLDYIFSSHCLEHIAEWERELEEWISKLVMGGRLFLYLPHPSCEIWLRGMPGIGDGHKWVPKPENINTFLKNHKMEIIYRDDGPDGMYSFSFCAEKVVPYSM